MSNYFEIGFSDLSQDKKDNLIQTVKGYLLENWSIAGLEYMKRDWHIKPKTWQEAFCRIETIDWDMWNDLDEKGKEFQEYDWQYSLEEYAEEQAEKRLYEAMRHLEIEVEL